MYRIKPSLWLLSGVCALGIFSASAEVISESAARDIAGEFLQKKQKVLKKAPVRVSDKSVYSVATSGKPMYYIFNNGSNAGFTIVSGDDRLPSILGYTESGDFDYDLLPDNLKWWLGEYAREIDYIYSKEVDNKLPARIIVKNNFERIEKKLTTEWDQAAPFNNMCPTDAGGRSVTGCVATAMAQVINYHEWPVNGKGKKNGIDFAAATYDYANMLDKYVPGSYNQVEADAVAQLMHHCGVSVDMNYSSYMSGAQANAIQRGLINYFKYNPGTKILYRDYIPFSEWETIVYNELDKIGPVICCGASNEGGHCFVIDGYEDDGLFHLNWGWNGYQDGFFMLNLLSPAYGGIGSFEGGYNSNQSIITELTPAGVADTRSQNMLVSTNSLAYDEEYNAIVVNGGDGNLIYNPLGYAISGKIYVAFEKDTDPENVTYAYSTDYETLMPYYGYGGFPFENPELADGRYKVYLANAPKKRPDEYNKIKIPVEAPQYLMATVSNGNFSYTELSTAPTNEESKGYITAIEGTNNLCYGMKQFFRATFCNTGTEAIDARYGVELRNLDTDKQVANRPMVFKVNGGKSQEIEFSMAMPEEPGNYALMFYKGSSKREYYEYQMPLTLKEKPVFNINETPSVTVDKISDHFYVKGAESNPVYSFTNKTDQNQSVTMTFRVVDHSGREVYSRDGYITLTPAQTLEAILEMGTIDIEAGSYFLVVSLDNPSANENDVIIRVDPINVIDRRLDGDEIHYVVTSESEGKARFSTPRYGSYYKDEVAIPELIDGKYTISVLDGRAMLNNTTVTSFTIPSTVKAIAPGFFYTASSLRSIRFNSAEPPVLGDDAFSENGLNNTLLYVPAGSAAAYKAAKGWQKFHVPSWKFKIVENGITMPGVDMSKPMYVGSDETPEIMIAGLPEGAEFFVGKCTLSDGSTSYVTGQNVLSLPALGLLDGECQIYSNLSVVDEIIGESGDADVYNLSGMLIKRGADSEFVRNLPAGIYIVGGHKLIKN